MKKIATTTLVGLAIALSVSDLSAQVCNGTAPFSLGKMRAGLTIAFPTNATSFGGEFAVGSASGLFGGASLSTIDVDGATESAMGFGLHGGKAMPVGKEKKIEMCPQVFFDYTSGPNSGTFEVSSNSLGGAVTFGTTMKQTSFDFIPFGGGSIHRDAVKVTSGGTSGDASETNLSLVAGAGFVLSKKWTVRPAINVPLTNNGDATISILGAMNFGGKP